MTNDPPAHPYRFGVLSTARIAVEKVIPGIQRSALARVTAIASRDGARAEQAAQRLGLPKAYGSYEELLADPEIDAIYNPLPNNLHVDWTLKAVAAGKAVLCEKPIGMDAADAARLEALPPESFVQEAFMVRFHPQYLRAREILRAGEAGDLRALQMFFSYFNDDPQNIRNQPETGGGALLDIGCYPITAARFFFEAEPVRVSALIENHPVFGTDRLTTAILDFGDGRRADFTVSTELVPYQRLNLFGTRKRLEIQIPANAPQAKETRIALDDGSILGDGSAVIETIRSCDQYGEQADAFARMARGETPRLYGIPDAVQSMRIIDAVFRSARSGRFETVV